MKTLKELDEKYDLELEKIISEINNLKVTRKSKSKLVLLQFPDGLKPYAVAVVDYLLEKTNAEFLIWLGSCYGACDIPVLDEKTKKKVDLIIQFGHNDMMPKF